MLLRAFRCTILAAFLSAGLFGSLTTTSSLAQDASSEHGSSLRLIPAQGPVSAPGASEAVDRVARKPESPVITAVRPLAQEGSTESSGAGSTQAATLAKEIVSTQETPSSRPSAELRARISAVLDRFANQRLNSRQNSPWQVMHRIVAYGVETKIEVGRAGGSQQSAIGWLLYNQPFRGQRILTARQNSVFGAEGAGVQGHAGQLLAILAQSRLKRDYPIRVGNEEFTVEDLIRSEQWTCRSGTELTFKLIGLSYYLPSDATWKASDGQVWSIERLVREEISQRIQGGTCGGTHRLMGLTYAVVTRKQQGLEITGDFARASTYINEYIDYAMKLRNPDGSFSTSFLERRAASPDPALRLKTTGHVLEWIAFAVSDDVLIDAEIVQSVEYLTNLLEQSPERSWEIGPLGHALHALAIYEQRVWGKAEVPARSSVSQSKKQTAASIEAR